MFGLKALIGEGLLFVVVVVGGWAVGGDGGGDGNVDILYAEAKK